MTRAHLSLLTAVAIAGALGCERLGGSPAVPSPLTNESRYLCCNMHYEKPAITDVNYLRGTLIPFGTRVQILEVRKNKVKFQPAGHPPITLTYRHGRNTVPMSQYLDRIFVQDDPRARLPQVGEAARPAKGGKGQRKAPEKPTAGAEKTRKAIEQGTVEPGMTREQVLMAVGYPPAHRTPSLEAPTWTYWANRWVTYEVYFDGDRVARVSE